MTGVNSIESYFLINRSAFQSKMFACIMKNNPSLFGQVDTDKLDGKGLPVVHQDFQTKQLFNKSRTIELFKNWTSQNEPDMCQFLRSNGIAV